jgi:hypothetical protein
VYSMRYCPNCSAYQHDGNATHCEKCGFDFSAEIERKEKRRKEIEEEELRNYAEKNAVFDPGHPCSVCGSPSKHVEEEIEHPVEGNRVPIRGIKLMGGDITKKPITLLQFRVKGNICSSGHKIYTDYDLREKRLCPICQDKLVFYGSSLLSCPRCNRHFQSEYFATMDPQEALKEEGWLSE